jgi:hypothetical protein
VQAKPSNKRLSIEGAKESTPTTHTPTPQNQAVSPPVDQSPTPRAKAPPPANGYVVEHIDVTAEVNRRLQESRLRRLMETPSTAQKRKRDAFTESSPGSVADTEGDDAYSRNEYSGNEYDRTPTKRLKSSGAFEQTLKRKENDTGGEGRVPDRARANYKRRRA